MIVLTIVWFFGSVVIFLINEISIFSLSIGSSYVDGVSRRELFRLAFENRLIEDVNRWMDFHRSRNETAHTYNQGTAEEVFCDAELFITDAQNLFRAIETRND